MQIFSSSQFKGKSSLTCPSCGTVFQFGSQPLPPSSPPKQSSPSRAKPARPAAPRAPVAKPVAPNPAPVAPVARVTSPPSDFPALFKDGAPTNAHRNSSQAQPQSKQGGAIFEGSVRDRLRRRRWTWMHLVYGVIGLFLMAGVVLILFKALDKATEGTIQVAPKGKGPQRQKGGNIVGSVKVGQDDYEDVFEVRLQKKAWKANDEIRLALEGIMAFEKTSPPTWFAVAAANYGTSKPRSAELVRKGVERLDGLFGENLEMNADAESTTFAGLPAKRLVFRGRLKTVQWWGHCYMFTHRGIGYWFVYCMPKRNEIERSLDEFEKQEKRFTLLPYRNGWQPLPPKMINYKNNDHLVALRAPEGVWREENAKDLDEQGVLALYGQFRKEKDNRKNATVLIVSMDKEDDLKAAIQKAQDRVESWGKEVRLADRLDLPPGKAKSPKLGAATSVGDGLGRIAELALYRTGEAEPFRFVFVAVVNGKGYTYVIRGDCAWEAYQIWNQDFRELLSTLTVKRK